MAPQRKRENRENNFHNVGVQGRKTGITLADRGIYDEHGLEPISGIFSSPEKSPPKRGGNITASESMDLQESTIPELTTSHQILRNNRTHLPPPRSRSPKKTMLGSSPRRQSSMAPRGSSIGQSSPTRAASHPIARRLDFDQDESSLQETPALSGSGARRGKRNNVYDIPEDGSPLPQQEAVFEESMLQEEITANDDSVVINTIVEESFAEQVGNDTTNSAEATEDVIEQEESEIAPEPEPEPVKEPAKRGRKRKSDVLELAKGAEVTTSNQRKRTTGAAKDSITQKKGNKDATVQPTQRRRSQRVSDINEQDASIMDALLDTSIGASEQTDEAPVAPKRRGRPPRVQSDAGKENAAPVKTAKAAKPAPVKERGGTTFKKPALPLAKPKDKPEPKSKPEKKAKEKTPQANIEDAGKLVDVHGRPISKQDIEKMSIASTTSRYGRGRHLSVFREMDPDAVARVGRTGRHRVAPIDFWKNESIAYDTDGSMTAIVKNQDPEPERKAYRSTANKGKKRALTAIDEEEVDLEPWEEEEGMLVGNFRDYDPVTDLTTNDIVEQTIAWAPKCMQPEEVADGSFRYQRLGSAQFFNWGIIELRADQMKRSKNARKMHMVFNVQFGTVECKVHENEFTVHKGGVWQVPRGNTYSIKNIGTGTARIFFAQGREMSVHDDE